MSITIVLLACITNPFADTVISYDSGVIDSPGYNLPESSLGEPTRFTGENIWPGVVSPFNPPWLANEIVSIGSGGTLTVKFDEPIQNDSRNPYGIDFIIFGNTGLLDGAWPLGIVDGVFSDDGGTVEVSNDGSTWFLIADALADGLWPTNGYMDSGPYDKFEGRIETDFTLPIDPRLDIDHVMHLTSNEIAMYYGTSGGGTGIDFSETGLAEVQYIRINAEGKLSSEIDAIADVKAQLPGDVDLNGLVNVNDLLIVIESFGPLPIGGPLADFNHDYQININDLLILIGNWS